MPFTQNNLQSQHFQLSGKAINDKVRLYSKIGRALLEAKRLKQDPFLAIEEVIPWDIFSNSIIEAEKLAQPETFDFLSMIGANFNQLRRYTPILLETLKIKSSHVADDLMKGIEIIKDMNARQARKVPNDAPISFVRKRWDGLVKTSEGIDRRFYELCILFEMKNSLRSGDLWVKDSRQFKDFEEYLLPRSIFVKQYAQKELGLPIQIDSKEFLESRLNLLKQKITTVEQLATNNELPDASITNTGHLKIT